MNEASEARASRGTVGPFEQALGVALGYYDPIASRLTGAEFREAVRRCKEALLALPVAERMEAMGMENIGWTSEPYGDLHVLNEQEVAALDARADNGDPTFRGTFRPVYREAGRA